MQTLHKTCTNYSKNPEKVLIKHMENLPGRDNNFLNCREMPSYRISPSTPRSNLSLKPLPLFPDGVPLTVPLSPLPQSRPAPHLPYTPGMILLHMCLTRQHCFLVSHIPVTAEIWMLSSNISSVQSGALGGNWMLEMTCCQEQGGSSLAAWSLSFLAAIDCMPIPLPDPPAMLFWP